MIYKLKIGRHVVQTEAKTLGNAFHKSCQHLIRRGEIVNKPRWNSKDAFWKGCQDLTTYKRGRLK